MHPKDKFPSQLKQNIIYKWPCPGRNCNLSYMRESSRCLESRVNEHNSHITRAVYINSISNKHSQANIFYFKIIDQDSKHDAREDGETIHIRINDLALKFITGKMYILEIFNYLLGADRSSNEPNQVDSDLPQCCAYLTIPSKIYSKTISDLSNS